MSIATCGRAGHSRAGCPGTGRLLRPATGARPSGDVVFIPAGTEHWYENTSGEPCEFLCSVPITEEYDMVWVEEPPEGAHE